MPDILISEFMHPSAVATLESRFDVHYDSSLGDDPEALVAAAGEARALIVRNRTMVDEALLDRLPTLAVVGRLGVGLDNIDVDACRSRGEFR